MEFTIWCNDRGQFVSVLLSVCTLACLPMCASLVYGYYMKLRFRCVVLKAVSDYPLQASRVNIKLAEKQEHSNRRIMFR